MELSLPAGAQILTVQIQDDKPMLWALIDPNETLFSTRILGIYGTGHNVPYNPGKYISTFQLKGMVFHVFETCL